MIIIVIILTCKIIMIIIDIILTCKIIMIIIVIILIYLCSKVILGNYVSVNKDT